jgi:hypothetical protein
MGWLTGRGCWVAVGALLLGGCDSAPAVHQHVWQTNDPDASESVDSSVAADSSVDTTDAVADALVPIDAQTIDKKPGTDAACQKPLGWWATNAAFDSSITPATFKSGVNPLLVGQHPVTIADYVDSSSVWTLRASGTLTNGSFQQYFPYTNPSDAVGMTRLTASFSSASAASQGWLVVVDASSTNVWVALANVTVSASYLDAYCQKLTGGQLDGVIPSSAGSTSITTKSGGTTLGALLGTYTSSSPQGWNIRLGFDGEKVQVSSK